MKKGKDRVTLLAGGDVSSAYEPVDQLAELILPVLRQADLRFGQCEAIYAKRGSGPKFTHRGYLHPRQASIWKTAGIDVISLASNRTMDYGAEALLDTIELFRGMGKRVVGAGKDIAKARKPAIVKRNGVKIAFLAYCSVLPEGHEAERNRAGIAPMRAHTYYQRGGNMHEDFQPGTPPVIRTVPHDEDLQALQEDIRKARRQAHVVVMSIHWGLHHIPKTICDYQPVVAHAAIDAGADLILGHHAHCLKAVETYKGKVCFYSLGNFMLTPNNPDWPRPSKWNLWNLWWYRHTDPEYLPPKGVYHQPPDSRKTVLAKAVLSRKGVERISFLPAFINPKAQPAVVAPGDRRFREILDFMEWLSDQYPHRFRVNGNEIVVE